MDVADWLQSLRLEEYASAFQNNHIGWDLLPNLTADDLKDLGTGAGCSRLSPVFGRQLHRAEMDSPRRQRATIVDRSSRKRSGGKSR